MMNSNKITQWVKENIGFLIPILLFLSLYLWISNERKKTQYCEIELTNGKVVKGEFRRIDDNWWGNDTVRYSTETIKLITISTKE